MPGGLMILKEGNLHSILMIIWSSTAKPRPAYADPLERSEHAAAQVAAGGQQEAQLHQAGHHLAHTSDQEASI